MSEKIIEEKKVGRFNIKKTKQIKVTGDLGERLDEFFTTPTKEVDPFADLDPLKNEAVGSHLQTYQDRNQKQKNEKDNPTRGFNNL